MVFSTFGTFLMRSTSSPYAIALGLGLASSSYFFWGNAATYYMGAATISLNPENRKNLGIDISKSVEIWAWFYAQGAKHMGISGGISALALFFAALQAPPGLLAGTGVTQNYLLAISACLLSSGVYTLGIMLPTNNRILAIRDKITSARSTSDSAEKTLTTAQEDEAETLLQKWKKMHYLRILTGGIGWLGTLAAYTMTI